MADQPISGAFGSILSDRRNLWIALGCLVSVHYLLVISVSSGSLTQVSLAFLVWWGAWICSEDLVATRRPSPTRAGLFLGSLVLVLCILRGSTTLHPDNLLTLLAPVEGVALALLYQPFRGLGKFRSSFYILLLLPLQVILFRLLSLSEAQINLFTAAASGFLLRLIGRKVNVSGTDVLLPTGGVTVHGPCNGADMICLLLTVSIIFLICFPIRNWLHRFLVIAAAPAVAMISNSFRIAVLTLFAASPSPASDARFDFFHDEAGSLLFSGVAVSLLAMFYLALLHHQFSPRRTSNG